MPSLPRSGPGPEAAGLLLSTLRTSGRRAALYLPSTAAELLPGPPAAPLVEQLRPRPGPFSVPLETLRGFRQIEQNPDLPAEPVSAGSLFRVGTQFGHQEVKNGPV